VFLKEKVKKPCPSLFLKRLLYGKLRVIVLKRYFSPLYFFLVLCYATTKENGF